jgi:hypothetical protein
MPTNELPGQLAASKKPLKEKGDQVQYGAAAQAKQPGDWRLSHSFFGLQGLAINAVRRLAFKPALVACQCQPRQPCF